MSQKNEKLPTAAYKFKQLVHGNSTSRTAYSEQKPKKLHKEKDISIDSDTIEELVRRKDVEKLIMDKIRNNNIYSNKPLEEVLEEIQE